MDSLMSAQIKQTLYNTYQIDLSINSIQELTFQKLQQWSNSNSLNSDGKSDEIETFTPNDTVVRKISENDLHKVFFVHTVGAHIDLMSSIGTYLNAEVCRLQCSQNCKFQTIKEYSNFYGKLIRQKQPNGPYILCGLSYCVLLVLEIGSFLEAEGENVQIICIDGSPENIRSKLDEVYQYFDDTRNIVQQHILTNFAIRFPDISKSEVRINFIFHVIIFNLICIFR